MTIYSRPTETVFASGAKPGEVLAFPDILRGWGVALDQTEGKPPMEWMNDAFRRVDEAIRYLVQRGIAEWTATDDYPAGAYVQHGGKTYRSLLASKGTEPGTAALTWAEWGMSRSELAALAFSGKFGDLSEVPIASTTVQGLIEIATAAEAKALTDTLRAITPATLKGVLDQFRTGFIPGATFAEVDALTEDDGPIIVTDMGCYTWLWTESAYFQGYRNPLSGMIPQHFAPAPRAWEMPVTGGVWSASDPKQKRLIALFREYGHVVDAGDWAEGWGRIADLGGGNWKAPDLQNVFLRMAGTDADTANPRAVGTAQPAAIEAFYGAFYTNRSGAAKAYDGVSGGGGSGSGGPYLAGGTNIQTIRPTKIDGSGMIAQGAETRSENAAVAPVILI